MDSALVMTVSAMDTVIRAAQAAAPGVANALPPAVRAAVSNSKEGRGRMHGLRSAVFIPMSPLAGNSMRVQGEREGMIGVALALFNCVCALNGRSSHPRHRPPGAPLGPAA